MNYSIHTILATEERVHAQELMQIRLKDVLFEQERLQREYDSGIQGYDMLIEELNQNRSDQAELQKLMTKATARLKAPLKKHLRDAEMVQNKLESKLRSSGLASLLNKRCELWRMDYCISTIHLLIDALQTKLPQLPEIELNLSLLDPDARAKVMTDTIIPGVGKSFVDYKMSHTRADNLEFNPAMEAAFEEIRLRIAGDKEREALIEGITQQLSDLDFERKKELRKAEKYLSRFIAARMEKRGDEAVLKIENEVLKKFPEGKAKNKMLDEIGNLENSIIDADKELDRYNPGSVLQTELDIEMIEVLQGVWAKVKERVVMV